MKCKDGSLYSGITNNLDNRYKKHNSGKGAKYTRSHRPVRLVHFEEFKSQLRVMRREWKVKTFPRSKKEALIEKKNVEQIARAVIIKDGLVLVARRKGADNTFLPGGHIESGESPEEAIKRELSEEMKAVPVVGDFKAIIHNSYTDNKVREHEVNYVHSAEIPDTGIVSQEEHLEFFWVKVTKKELSKYKLKPARIRELVVSMCRKAGKK